MRAPKRVSESNLDGERTPDLPRAMGLLTGIRSDVSREQLARATVEGVVCNLLAAADADGRVVVDSPVPVIQP
jgi:xylulokinase